MLEAALEKNRWPHMGGPPVESPALNGAELGIERMDALEDTTMEDAVGLIPGPVTQRKGRCLIPAS